MVIHTGGKKRRSARADVVTSNRDKRSAQVSGKDTSDKDISGKDILQFAPNFSVYVLPSDAVCLYSEDRKFFLHGKLSCALASAIGKGGARFAQIIRALERDFPVDQIHEAVKRLIDRRYVVRASRASTGGVAAFWASIGLSPEAAAENLGKCRVRIESIDVKGAREIGAALTRLGVRVVKGAADLTVTLVNDYLEGRLDELNRRQLANRAPWVLVQPSGAFPLVGPVFRPGDGACWKCLYARMIRNREIKGFLERGAARPVAVSPLTKAPFGQGAVQLAAIEIAKAIATGFRTDLRDNVISLDLLGSTIARHHVEARPQCSACGHDRELRDRNREPAPIELKGGAKLVMTSGGYRTVSSHQTVARFRRHVSPLTGVVSRLERIEADLPLNASYYAGHNFSGPAVTVDELRQGLKGGSFGKGSTAEQGEASALMEAIERYSGIFQGDEIAVTRRFTDFAPGDAILPNDVLLFSDAQYRRRLAAPLNSPDSRDRTPTPTPFNRSAETEWSPVWSFGEGRFKYLPTSMLYFFHRAESDVNHISSDSNGCAAGNTIEEAIVQGFLELVERDAYAIWWYNRVQRPAVDLGAFEDTYVRDLQSQLAATGRRVWVLDITNDLGVPSFVAISHSQKDGEDFVEYGSGSHFDARIALLRTLTELNQFLSIGLVGGRDPEPSDGPFRMRDNPYHMPSDSPPTRPDLHSTFGQIDTREQVMACVQIAKRAGLDFLVLDQTRPDIGVPVARVVVPGLRHFYRRFAPGRLYDIPVRLGWLDRPVAESELNPLHPNT
jgi:ribosomal protein S12 methylthiotransferase accessory factor